LSEGGKHDDEADEDAEKLAVNDVVVGKKGIVSSFHETDKSARTFVGVVGEVEVVDVSEDGLGDVIGGADHVFVGNEVAEIV